MQLYDQHWLNKKDLQRMNILILHLIITLLIHILEVHIFLLLFSRFYTMQIHYFYIGGEGKITFKINTH